jgi:DNA-binding NarL/FixJ family response regulator
MNTRVVVVEDQPLMLTAIGDVLDNAQGFDVIGTATSGLQVEPLVSRTRPDLVLLDLNLPGLDGLSCLSLLRERHPSAQTVILTGDDAQEPIEEALRLGAAAYISKSIDPADIPAVLRQALAGNVYFTTPVASRGLAANAARSGQREQVRRDTGLTSRELEILIAVSRGLSNRAVGKELFVSDQTVKFHLNKIYRKLNVANRTEAARTAHQLGLVSEPAWAP